MPKHKSCSSAEFPRIAVQLHPFTSERFHALFTLSSKYFSTFPHGTCLLSDSCKYLALDGVYHPLWAAFSNNPTPRTVCRTHCWTWGRAVMPRTNLNTTLPCSQITTGFGAGLIPVHSQLLGESLLVSFPPLSDMLKFSGYSHLIRGQGKTDNVHNTLSVKP
ncbi:Protein TAR1 [Trichinella pseudospiralis]|uniref:Protein TAR1 n=1 Tax=Trichinella pseudospiralis TaxID=6337 RepID=A0A0V0XCS9_TRIPS|nr:Protein TAR1 [Trichinella pseudospiralis]